MARALMPVWSYWTNNGGESFIVGDLGYDIEGGESAICEVGNETDAKLVTAILKHVDARLP